jgi:3-oxosteroid 1-dehydrogenase
LVQQTQQAWDEECDVLVFGSGGGGMSAALFAARAGLQVMVCEKRQYLGGTTATSGGGIWVPGTPGGLAAGDTIERAREYLRWELGDHYRSDIIDAFLAQGAGIVETLNTQTDVKFELSSWPDYHSDEPGGAKKGRTLFPAPFDGKRLGRDFALLQPPMHRIMVLGGLMLGPDEVPDFLQPLSSVRAFRRVLSKLARYAFDWLRFGRGTDLRSGNAMIASMMYSMPRDRVSLRTQHALVELLKENGRVVGAVVQGSAGTRRIRARRAVVLATGGFPHDKDMLRTYGPKFPHKQSLGCEANVGEGIKSALAVGAAMDTDLNSVANWTPASVMRDRQGREIPVIYGYLDRGRPGVIAVDAKGRRFVNESSSYHDIVSAMFKHSGGEGTFHFVCDLAFARRHGLGAVRPWPWTRSLSSFVRSGYLTMASSLPELARAIGADEATLTETVQRHNANCKTGVDVDFGRGATAYNRMFGHVTGQPNPNLAPIGAPPYLALRIHAASLGTTIGLKTTADAQVVGVDGQPIDGLYACGNDLAAAFRGRYPGGGTTLGPAVVFGALAAQHITKSARPAD